MPLEGSLGMVGAWPAAAEQVRAAMSGTMLLTTVAPTHRHTPLPHGPTVASPARKEQIMEDVMSSGIVAAPGLLQMLTAALRQWWRERRMADVLYELDDALLKDIGVYRGEISSIVRAHCAGSGR